MNILDVINQYQIHEWSNDTCMYRCKVNVNDKFFISIIAGVGAYSTPRKPLKDFSHYLEYEIAFFDIENKWLKIKDEEEFFYERFEFTDVMGNLTPFEIDKLIKKLDKNWKG